MSTAQGTVLSSDTRIISLVSLAHGSSHFFQLVLPPLFPWFKAEFALTYAELGLLMTMFFIASGIAQAGSGFIVDRIGARPVLFVGVVLLGCATLVFPLCSSYTGFLIAAALMGLGNGIFHPVDYTLMNHKISGARLPHAYSMHGLVGYLGWALAPILMVGIAELSGWRVALIVAGLLELSLFIVLWLNRNYLEDNAQERQADGLQQAIKADPNHVPLGTFSFLKLPAVWLSWMLFFFGMLNLSGLQSFAPSAFQKIYEIDIVTGTFYLTLFSVGGAGGVFLGGFIAARFRESEKVITTFLALSVVIMLAIGFSLPSAALIPVLFTIVGAVFGIIGPSRDLLVRSTTPIGASGRVYGVVYSGNDLGGIFGPLLIGLVLDAGHPNWLFLSVAFFQTWIVLTAIKASQQPKQMKS